MKQVLSFLRSLRRHNDRTWFNEHKDQYLSAKAKVDALVEKLIAAMTEFEPSAASLRPADCTYRIYRDTRFSPDKTPYKDHIGIYINPRGGKKSPFGGYYLHIAPGECLVAAGIWCPEPNVLKTIRHDIFENVDEYLELIHDPEFSKFYSSIGDNLLKTAPKGFPKDWEHIDLLKPRDFSACAPLSDDDLCAPDAVERIVTRFRAAKPLTDFYNFSVENS